MGITIKTAVRFILNNEKIHNKKQLERWCKDDRAKLYNYVEFICKDHWNQLVDPKAYVRYEYQHMLDGYKIYKPNY